MFRSIFVQIDLASDRARRLNPGIQIFRQKKSLPTQPSFPSSQENGQYLLLHSLVARSRLAVGCFVAVEGGAEVAMVKHNFDGSTLTRILTVDTEDTYGHESKRIDQPLDLIRRGSVRRKIAVFENKTFENNCEEREDLYDLSPVKALARCQPTPPSFSVDPFEFSGILREEGEERQLSPE